MHYFTFKKNELYCENIAVSKLAEEFGTPLYIYSQRTFVEHFKKIKQAFSSVNPLICYSVKANSNLSLLKLIVKYGGGLDIVSGGELYKAKLVKCLPSKIVYASVGKTDEEIINAINSGILMFNVESIAELNRINQTAGALKKIVNVSLRVNPDVESHTHQYITTGRKETKFGMDIPAVKYIFLNSKNYTNLNIAGIHIHIGSQITESAPFIQAIKRVKNLLKELEIKKIFIKYFNIGGGLGIIYDKEKPQTADSFAQKILPLFKNTHFKPILEPGRFIVGNAGILVTKVLYIKDTPEKKFVIVDSAMNDLIRPSLYGAYHNIIPITKDQRPKTKDEKLADVVGPICESGDFLGKDRHLNVTEGEYLAVMGAGAYGFSMSSNYNSRPRAAEVLVSNNKVCIIRERETYNDLVRKEIRLH